VNPDKGKQVSRQSYTWQFSLRQLLSAALAVAIVFSLVGWVKYPTNGLIVTFAALVAASILVRTLSPVGLGSLAILLLMFAALFLRETLLSPLVGPLGRWPVDLCLGVIAAVLYAGAAILLRVVAGFRAWQLIAALVAFEVLFFAIVVEQTGFPWTDVFSGDPLVADFVLTWFFVQRWYIAVPWLSGTGIGEFIARKRRDA